MALFGDDQGKTEKPTPGRLNKVRDKGDTPLSRELVQGGVLLLAAQLFAWCGGWLIDSISEVMRRGLSLRAGDVAEVGGACREFAVALRIVGPPFGALLLAFVACTLLLGYGQIGVRISHEVLGLKLERLNPFTNWTKLFNVQSLVRTGFAVLKLAVIVGVLWLAVADRIPALLHLHEQPLTRAAGEIASLALSLMFWVGAIVTTIAVGDLFWQRYSFEKRNMMTRQEVEDERKSADGDPAVKQRQKRARNELMRHRMMQDVPKADVVITNPTHFSVALRYDRKRDAAPVVVAKGVDEIALIIRTIARQHDVPLMEDPPLARALFRAVKVGQGIPEKFYHAVAAVLGHVYRLKNRTA